MRNMTLSAIANACNGRLIGGEEFSTKEAAGVYLDSRQVGQDDIFIATVGERVDGHDYIDEVYAKGALAVICEKAPSAPKGPYILVENSLLALKLIAKWYRMQLDIKVVGITGSVGKTSTKEFVSSVLKQGYSVLKTEGNFNNEIGLPLTVLKIRDHHEIAVLEMGINQFGEMDRLSEIAKPDICVITNIGQCHLENLGSRQGILKAKSEIFNHMKVDGIACINGDDDMLSTLEVVKGRKPLRFGMNTTNDFFATDVISKGLFGSSCKIHIGQNEFDVNIPLPGEHMIYNALAATAVATILNMTTEEKAAGIQAVQPVGGRSNIIRHKNWTIIDDCYNANPVSMKAAIDLLSMADTNKVAILGDMGELGTKENALHKEVGSYAATAKIDVLICVGKRSIHMHQGAAISGFDGDLFYYETREELLAALPSLIKKQDTILVKASHSMGFENIVKTLMNLK